MTKDQIVKGNELIAKFKNSIASGYKEWGNLNYHQNWAALMPVINSIETLNHKNHCKFSVVIYDNVCTIEGSLFNPDETGNVYHATSILDSKIESVWSAVVGFLWFWDSLTLSVE